MEWITRSFADIEKEMNESAWVSVSYCAGSDWSVERYGPKPITRYVYESRKEAFDAKRQIDEFGCGGGCKGWHKVEKALSKEKPRKSYDIERQAYRRYGCTIPDTYLLPKERGQTTPRLEVVPSAERKKVRGIVYLIQAEGTTLVKIGRSFSARARLESLRTMSPMPLILIREIMSDDSHTLEKTLHQRYKDFRRHGEWFELPSVILAELLREEFPR